MGVKAEPTTSGKASAYIEESPLSEPRFIDREGVKSSAGIPLTILRETVGVMFVSYREPHLISASDRDVIHCVAAYSALGIQGFRTVGRRSSSRPLAAHNLTLQMFLHRLRNELPLVSSYLQSAVRSGTISGEALEYCQRALDRNIRSERVLSEFESFSKQETFPRPDRVSGEELIARLAKVIRANLTQGDARLDVFASPDAPNVAVNFDRLSEDFNVLLRDSEGQRSGGLRLTLSAELASAEEIRSRALPLGRYLKLIYQDNGPGVATGLKKRIFEPFFTTTGGVGLGLALAAYTAHVHGGTVIECGEAGHGARLEFYLPEDRAC